MISARYERADAARIHVFDADDLPWQAAARPGLRLKAVRYDDDRGHFLGLVHFAPMTRSGLHQHRGVATSFVVDGGLTDYHGSIGLHEAGINLVGATHDAVAYANTVLVARLEGPVHYPRDAGDLSGLHAGSRHRDDLVNDAPEKAPEINVAVDRQPLVQTGVAGIRHQTIYDYAGSGGAHRFVQLALQPGADCPPWQAGAPTEFWLRAGRLEIDGRIALSNSFVVIERGACVRMASPYGALLLVWAEGRERWLDEEGASAAAAPPPGRSLFGF